ncbi:O-methyltransferase [Kineosporia babensis]|uniref:Class I SAM-dependent methyltransferase n=1 Tax=Kineosporia babensis TaxID=499548 RepID=A0A9X1NM40_9ACTN|nr:class I SAM-dependent methyltransferase [Kineosporia babensis]MCD5316084.1 class I SAM-dependent methyltransferase [Kineosporia babensis]
MSAPKAPRPVTPASILAQQLEQLLRLAESIPGTDASLLSGLQQASRLAGGLDPYLNQHSSPASPDLQALEKRTLAHDWRSQADDPGAPEPEMLSGQVEGQLLQFLVHATRACDILEIGMFTGYSALAMAEALPTGGRVVTCELNRDVAAFAQESFATAKHGAKIDVRVGPAQETLLQLAAAGEAFDLVFIDADKAGYRSYLDTLLTHDLITREGLICVDNTLMQGQPWATDQPTPNGRAIDEFNRAVAEDPRVEQVLLPVRDGVTLIRRTEADR